ncbi:glycosyltransferase [Candidatus Uhrbacteria bacterium]|nr:glycosyltransferase [Candidatus Uhrbacteria bacterium]
MPRVSIVIPTKNEEAMLPRLMESIKNQTYDDYEVIVADAHSTDKTCSIAESYGAKCVEGGMPGPGRNKGAIAASGEIIVFFDADVLMPSTRFLQDCIGEMDKKGLDVASCKVKPISRKPVDKAMHEIYNAYAVATEKIRPHAPGFCILVRRHAHHGIKGFDEEIVLAEDHDYVQRAKKEGHKFGLLKSHPISVSVRRLEKDGRLALAIKYLFAELHIITRGAIKKELFEYEMGGEEKKPE